MTTNIRAVDVGYGNLKFSLSHAREGRVDCAIFPSIVAPVADRDFADGAIARRNTTIVRVDGQDFEVGPEAELARATHAARVLHSDFVGTIPYLALLKGALHYIGLETIDLLVVGLPVSYVSTKSAALRTLVEGTHALADQHYVTVKKALVLAQPLGGLACHTMGSGVYGNVLKRRNLVIDPGFFTVDWLTTSGVQPLPKRCGSFSGGVAAVTRAVAESLSSAHGIPLDELPPLEAALRDGYYTLDGHRLPLLPKYLESARAAMDDAAHAIANSTGSGRDLDAILMVGGGAAIYRDAITRRFSRHTVNVVPEPVLANVRGFQLIGEEVARRRQVVMA